VRVRIDQRYLLELGAERFNEGWHE
jgi:hypothetical protein